MPDGQNVLNDLEETLARHRAEMRELVDRFDELARGVGQRSESALLDHFAGLAMIGILAGSSEPTAEHVAERSYKQAKAMIAARPPQVDPDSERRVPGTFAETIFASGVTHPPDDDEPAIGDEVLS